MPRQLNPQTGLLKNGAAASRSNADDYTLHAYADSTRTSYASDWRDFTSWCAENGVSSLPADPADVAKYLSAITTSDGAKTSTMRRRVSAINFYHDEVELERPGASVQVRRLLRGVARMRRDDVDRAAPLRRELLARCVQALAGAPLQILRDRMVLCVGFYGALRRSELVAIQVEHVTWHAEGMALMIPFSKTDQEGKGEVIAIRAVDDETCAVAAMRAWLAASAITEGPVVRGLSKHGTPRKGALSAGYVNEIVKAAVMRAGEDPEEFSGHSMRAGFVTSARERGVPDRIIMHTTRHRDARMIATYDRVGEAFHGAVEW